MFPPSYRFPGGTSTKPAKHAAPTPEHTITDASYPCVVLESARLRTKPMEGASYNGNIC